MDTPCEKTHDLMSGYLDEELDEVDTEGMEVHLAQCETCRAEFEEMTLLISASDTLSVELPPEEVWDEFLQNVYNRTERQTGWIAFIIGTTILLAWGIFEMFITDWAEPVVKFFTALALIGITILFISVLRQRLVNRKTDRYSSDIHH
jgi:predicted anti-sigma-YlaC factor YlaD